METHRQLPAYADRVHAGVHRLRMARRRTALCSSDHNTESRCDEADQRGHRRPAWRRFHGSAPSGTFIDLHERAGFPTGPSSPAFALASWNRAPRPGSAGRRRRRPPLDIAKKTARSRTTSRTHIDLGVRSAHQFPLTVKVRADDGAVLRVNGKVVDTKRMTDAKHYSYDLRERARPP